MSTHFNPSPLPPAAKPSKSWREKKWVPFAAVGCGMLLVGMGIGGAGKGKEATAAPSPVPTVTSTVTASASPAPTITKAVEVTPAVCLKYIDLSEKAFSFSAEAMGYMSDAMKSASVLDVAGVKSASANLDVLNPKLSALTPQVNEAKAGCRAAGK